MPALTTDSSLSNYLTYALLNQPKVEAAYYDWRASIERITQARSLPDPQLTFQMDIQNIVTSIMPGLMGSIPWPDKLRVGAQIASAESQSKYFAFQSAVLQSAFEVKRAYYQLYFLAEKIRVNQRNADVCWPTWKSSPARRTKWAKSHCRTCCARKSSRTGSRPKSPTWRIRASSLLAQFKAALGLSGNDPDTAHARTVRIHAAGPHRR